MGKPKKDTLLSLSSFITNSFSLLSHSLFPLPSNTPCSLSSLSLSLSHRHCIEIEVRWWRSKLGGVDRAAMMDIDVMRRCQRIF